VAVLLLAPLALLAAQGTPTSPAGLPAGERFLPHGYCFLWNRPLLWTHVVADSLIGLAYVTISFSLAWLVHRARREIPFSIAFVMFGLFIVTCGMTHFLEVVTFWTPIYPTLGAVKVVTAIASVSTAVAMPTLAPRVRATVRDARTARERELAAARADARSGALEEANRELTRLNASLQAALADAERQRATAEGALALAEAERMRAERERANADAERANAETERARAHEANEAKAQFLATMSHELRTPLNAIGGYVQLVDMGIHGPVTAPQRDALARVQRAQRHLLGLINDVLNYARLEAGRVEYDVRPVEVGTVVEQVGPLVEPLMRERGLRYAVRLPDASCRVWADREKLGQVLVNLLSNAAKFTEPQGAPFASAASGSAAPELVSPGAEPEEAPDVVVDVVTAAAGDGGGEGEVRVRVRDRGRGIPRDQHERIFEPFVQVRVGGRPYAGAVEGTGLGLAISRDLARGMGGDLTVESGEGEGSTFSVVLRRVQ
jgi:signal transduction histidine kinase